MNITTRLKIMMFGQYFIWGSWLLTLSSYLMQTLNFTGAEVGIVYSSQGISALIMPCLVGIIADKFIPAKYLYMFCHLFSALTLIIAAQITSPSLMFWIMLANALVFMPTLALSNSISYYCLDKNKLETISVFPKIRVLGTVGFVMAMWSISLLKFELSNYQLYFSAAASIVLIFYIMTLPNVPICKNKQTSWTSRLGLDAFVLFKRPIIAVFFIFAMLLGAILQITNTFGSPFLHDFSKMPEYADSIVVQYPAILLSLSQIAEIGFILAIPFFLKRLGIKTVMLISLLAWTLRFGLFAYGNPSPTGFVLLILSMIIYGCAFDFFNISGSIFIEKEVNPSIRASAQGLYMTMINGIGAYVGSILSGLVIDKFTAFDGVKDWHSIWLIFAAYAFILFIAFYFLFNYRHPKNANQ